MCLELDWTWYNFPWKVTLLSKFILDVQFSLGVLVVQVFYRLDFL